MGLPGLPQRVRTALYHSEPEIAIGNRKLSWRRLDIRIFKSYTYLDMIHLKVSALPEAYLSIPAAGHIRRS